MGTTDLIPPGRYPARIVNIKEELTKSRRRVMRLNLYIEPFTDNLQPMSIMIGSEDRWRFDLLKDAAFGSGEQEELGITRYVPLSEWGRIIKMCEDRMVTIDLSHVTMTFLGTNRRENKVTLVKMGMDREAWRKIANVSSAVEESLMQNGWHVDHDKTGGPSILHIYDSASTYLGTATLSHNEPTDQPPGQEG